MIHNLGTIVSTLRFGVNWGVIWMGKYISSSEPVIGVLNIRNLISVSNLLRCLYPDQEFVTIWYPDLGVSEKDQGPVGPEGLGGTEIVPILGEGTVPILLMDIFRDISVQKKEVFQSRRDRSSRGSRKYMRQPPVPVSWYLRVTPHQTHGRMSLIKNEPVKG